MVSMRRGCLGAVMVFATCAALVVGGGGAGAATAAGSSSGGGWATGIEVPGIGALNVGGDAGVGQLSCSSPGNCTVGGFYTDRSGHQQAVVASEANGRWGRAEEVPGTAALNRRGHAQVVSVACAARGACAAAGSYLDSSGHLQLFVASEHDGAWAPATVISVPAALGTDTSAIDSLSCPSAGNCAAGGSYELVNVMNGIVSEEAMVVNESGGVWGQVQEVPGTAALNAPHGGLAVVLAVSCGAAGSCVAGGGYDASRSTAPAFLAEQADGRWDDAIDVPGLTSLNTDGSALVESVSCASAGNCAAAGFYLTPKLITQLFVISEADGVWGNAIEVPGLAGLDAGRDAGRNISVSCPAAGHCALASEYTDHKGHTQLLVDSQS